MLTKKKIPWSWCDLYETVRNDLVYYDSGIWVAYFLGEADHHHEISKYLVGLVEKGEKRAVVSYLLIMEATHVIRRRVVQRSKNLDPVHSLNAAMKVSSRFTDYVNNGLDTGRLILARSDGIACHDQQVFKKMSSVQGEIRGKRDYRELGHADIEHAYLADYGGALEFHTKDRSFKDLDLDPDFTVKFVVHESPWKSPSAARSPWDADESAQV